MALFWSKKPKAEKNFEGEAKKKVVKYAGMSKQGKKAAGSTKQGDAKAAPAAPKTMAIPSGRFDAAASVIVRPHVTEKSGILSQGGVYTFVVSADANKPAVMKAVKGLYKVTATKVAIINLPAKQIFARGKWGMVPAIRKAVVTVKKGDKIDFV
jgi:large subunit ribosomal protein L23